jgi:hypothetical protein
MSDKVCSGGFMVAWWKRLLFSLASVVAAAVVCLGCVVLVSALKSHPVNFRGSEVILTVGVTVAFCLVGWIFSVPAILLVKRISGARFWVHWVLGSCVGPVLMLGICVAVFFALPHAPGASWFNPALRPLVYMATAISSLTALFYLSLLKWAQGRWVRGNVAADSSARDARSG